MGSRATAKLIDFAFGALAAVIPLALAIVHARRSDGIEAACDEGVVRVLGRGYTGLLHGLDALLPARAPIACAALLGFATFVIARRLVRGAMPSVLGLVLAVVAAALATTTFPAQREAVLVSGNALGALLVIGPLALAMEGAPAAAVFALVGLAATYDAAIATCAIAGMVALFAVTRTKPRALSLIAIATGAIPIAWMAARRDGAPEMSLDSSALASLWGEGVASARGAAFTVASRELGAIALAFAAIGAFVGLRSRVTRAAAASLGAIAIGGAVVCALGAPAGPARFSGALLAALAALSILAACGMAAIVSAVARAKIPLARASAAMIVLLELAVPVRVLDDASLAMSKRDASATARWNARVFGDIPHGAVLLVPTARLFLRSRAARASHALAEDVLVIPTYGLGAHTTSAVIAHEPLASPLVRDLALYGAPEEFSLSQLAAARPTLVAFDPRWDKRFARHLVPEGSFDHYFVEPRGPSDRLKAFAPLAVHDDDALLALATRDLLRARALGAAASGEREWADATTAELRRAAPLDPTGIELAQRLAKSHGPVDVADLSGRY